MKTSPESGVQSLEERASRVFLWTLDSGLRTALFALGVLALPVALYGQLAVNRLELMMHPGGADEREGVIGVRNESQHTVQAVVRLEDWDRSSDGTNRWYEYRSRPGSCGAVLAVFPLAVSLDPGASQSVRVMLDSTARLSLECWAAVVIETVQPRTVQDRGLAYVIRTAVKVYVAPPGLPANGAIAGLRVVDADSASAPAAARQLEVAFDNTGARHVMAQGTVEYRRRDNSVAARVALPPVYALPGARQVVRGPLPRLERGSYVVLVTLDFGGDEIAAAQIEYDVP